MTLHSTPLTPSLHMALHPRQQLLFCLPAGSRLHAISGCVRLRMGPMLCGQVLHEAQYVLQAGHFLPQEYCVDTTWLRIENLGHQTARLLYTEAASPPSVSDKALAWWSRLAAKNWRSRPLPRQQ